MFDRLKQFRADLKFQALVTKGGNFNLAVRDYLEEIGETVEPWSSLVEAGSSTAQATVRPEVMQRTLSERMKRLGPPLWKRLHEFARRWDGDAAKAEAFFKEFKVPCGTCRSTWRRIITKHPADLSSPAAFFKWTVDRHNDVRRELSQIEMSHEDAQAFYS